MYAAKSAKENTTGGIQYEAAMREWDSQNIQEEEFDEEAQG